MPQKTNALKLIRALERLKKGRREPAEFFRLWNKLRHLLYETPDYKNFLVEVRTRAGGKCELPKCTKAGREVHHIIRVYDNPAAALEVDNAILLCKSCHKKQHKRESK